MTNPAILEALARAIHCHDGRLPTPWDADMIARWPDDCEYERKVAMSQAAAVLDLCEPEPLVWEHYEESDTYPEAWTSDTPRGFITILKDGDSKYRIIWEWVIECDTEYPTLEAAQAAAQAHADAAHWANTKIGGAP